MLLKIKTHILPLLSMALLVLAISLAGCTSKEQALKEKQETLEKFVTSLTMNVFDRNPDTIKESMGQLMRLQLNEKARNTLQGDGEIPDTELDVLKIIDDNQTKHLSNKVQVDSVKAQGPIDKNEVPFKVTGKSVTLLNGKPSEDKPFTITVVCLLTPDMGGYPKCIEIDGLPGNKKTAVAPANNSRQIAAPRRRRHR